MTSAQGISFDYRASATLTALVAMVLLLATAAPFFTSLPWYLRPALAAIVATHGLRRLRAFRESPVATVSLSQAGLWAVTLRDGRIHRTNRSGRADSNSRTNRSGGADGNGRTDRSGRNDDNGRISRSRPHGGNKPAELLHARLFAGAVFLHLGWRSGTAHLALLPDNVPADDLRLLRARIRLDGA